MLAVLLGFVAIAADAQEAEQAVNELANAPNDQVDANNANAYDPNAYDPNAPSGWFTGTKKKGFASAFVASLSVIIVSEIGDKTFFIAAIMAMTHPRKVIFIGAIAALALMTVLSVAMGFATTIIPRYITYYASTMLFVFFGLKMLRDGWKMSPDEGQEELEEVTLELKQKEQELESRQHANADVESGGLASSLRRLPGLIPPVMMQAFVLTFLAEWGDRSQITTIILGATEDPIGVSVGGTLGHALCTGLAVLGGQLLAKRISVRTVTLIGAVLFLLFALINLVQSPDE
ncbi:TPA regulated locus [Capsaspora owczarzaki ATCC 30864]|uniref:GDT1 family protein n=2 Tax=Capsaspora owczarzaki (strain ATCC 30864) TaxID=595528 RepID=A0A0D2WS63_CAPO3|nr:TPA regulated locus [Capsaspora owczarzaki ATCC 30864]